MNTFYFPDTTTNTVFVDSSLPSDEDMEKIKYIIYLCLCFGIGILLLAIVVLVLCLRRERKKEDGMRTLVMSSFTGTIQHSQSSPYHAVLRTVPRQENYYVPFTRFGNINRRENDTGTAAMTPSPVQSAPGNSPSPTNDTEYKRRRSPLQNETYSDSSESLYQVYVNDDIHDNPLFGHPPDTAVPTYGATHDCPLYDRPPQNPVRVNKDRTDATLYDLPPQNPVPANNKTLCGVIYDRPRQNLESVCNGTYDEYVCKYRSYTQESAHDSNSNSLYDRPSNIIMPVREKADDNVYERLSTLLSLANDDTSGSALYDRPSNITMPIREEADDNVYQNLSTLVSPADDDTSGSALYDRPSNITIPIREEADDNIYQNLSTLVSPADDDTNGSALYDRLPPPKAVALDATGGNQTPRDYSPRSPFNPRPAPRPSKSVAVTKIQKNPSN